MPHKAVSCFIPTLLRLCYLQSAFNMSSMKYRQYSTTLKEARDMIDTRVNREEAKIKEAMTIRRADKIDGCTTNLQKIGFFRK